jgi:YidC/Oxa1 family membrane protein insertase
MLANLFHTVLYQPIFNIFVGIYNLIPGHDVGVVIIIITVLVRLALYPLTNSSLKAQKSIQDIQPKIDEIKKKYATDKQAQSLALMQVYKDNKVNPFASCLPLLIQLPILIALYMVMRAGLTTDNFTEVLYPFITNPGHLNPISFGFLDLAKPNYILPILAGLAQFWQAKSMNLTPAPKAAGTGAKDENMMSMMNKQMLYFMPALTVIIGFQLPGGLVIYWLFTTLLTVAQQKMVFGKDKKKETKITPPPANVIEGKIEE